MVRRVKVTRDGFTRCPACSSHIKVAVVLSETACPFCETALTASTGRAQNSLRQVLSRSLVVGRSGLIAASLLGLAATGVSCESGSSSTDVIADVAPEDAGPQPAYGIPADIVEDTAPDLGPQPEYGAPPEDAGAQPADVQQEDAPDSEPQAEYGAPPDPNDP
jgi:hypothetical protein